MAVKFTEEQQQVINLRNKNLLVSAAAGSGKTAVLVERIISRITRDQPPLDIDEMLVVTFTNAAAAEMRERIGDAIEGCLEQKPEDAHLQRQQTLLHHAQITTIHSFCLYLIRNYFHRIDLDPDFRIGEEGELRLLRQDVLGQVLEEYYSQETPEFQNLVETIATGKTDDKLKETILTLYGFAVSEPWPEHWLNSCVLPYEVQSVEEIQASAMGQTLLAYVKSVTGQWLDQADLCVELCQEPDGPKGYLKMISAEQEMIQETAYCMTLRDFQEKLTEMTFGRLPALRNFAGNSAKKELVMSLRNEIKADHKKLMEQFFGLPLEFQISQLALIKPVIRALVEVTIRFSEAYQKRKLEKNLLDFNDLEHYALKILVDQETGEPTQTAKELQQQFCEVMVDEYQDSNYVQEAILQAVSRRDNRFMVGDVKQSIYRFRMARPELFMEKYDTYPEVDRAQGQDARIDLHRNFRSRPEVLSTVNNIFYYIMGRDLGNVEYDQQAALYPGMSFAEPEDPQMFQTQVLLMDREDLPEDQKGVEDVELEALLIAREIKKLRGIQQVTDSATGTLRQADYGDMVILVRSISAYGPRFLEVLKDQGIPALTTTGTGYFSAVEVQNVLNLLRLVDNPRQDIPMAAVLKSPIGGLTAQELAKLRIADKTGTFYQCVWNYLENGEDPVLLGKLKEFIDKLQSLRSRVADTPIHELLYQAMDETGYLDYVSALPGGRVRRANLEILVEKAIAYERTSYHGLFHFIRYINQLENYQVDYGEAQEDSAGNVVRIMTIHKSKGLEFPLVFVAGMGRGLNQQDSRRSMVLHPVQGIGIDITDFETRVKYPSFIRQTLAKQVQMENIGEELRVLYVAMTRAKEKLILTGIQTGLRGKLEDYWEMEEYNETQRMDFLDRLGATCYLNWVLPVVSRDPNIRLEVILPQQVMVEQIQEEIRGGVERQVLETLADYPQESIYQEISRRLLYEYPYASEQALKQKLSVSELKHRAMDQLRGEVQEGKDTTYLFEPPQVIPYIPGFIRAQEENMGALRGTAMHRVLECLDFTKDFQTVEEQIQEMLEQGRLSQEQAKLLSMGDLKYFLASSLAQRMQQAAREGHLYKEKPFVMGKPANQVESDIDSDTMVLIQGIIDVFFQEEGQIVLVDYKTDAVKTGQELADRYRAQILLYQEALEQAVGLPVKERLLYSFRLKEEVPIE